MKLFWSFLFITISQYSLAQITNKPSIEKKASSDTFIRKVEITEEFTIMWMQYKSKSAQEGLKEYLNNNPQEKEQLSRMNPAMRDMLLQQMMGGMEGTTISIQPNTFLQASDGRKYAFIKASSIPVAPDRKQVKPEEDYFFKVYFEKLDEGVQRFDFIEGVSDERDGFQYWNFYGIVIDNPGEGVESFIPRNEVEFTLSGKVYDALTNQPISAKIICTIEGEELPFDSVQTSKTGYYEFLIEPAYYVYIISAPGYELAEEAFDLSSLKSSLVFSRDIYLEPIEEESLPLEKEPIEEASIEKVDENTLRLNHVYFPTGEADILEDSYLELRKVVEMMNQNTSMEIRIDGHTDNQGDSRLNQILSLDRAKNVRDYLISQGIPPERISFKGWGDTKPLEMNADAELRQKNRRVEIIIIEK